MRRKVIAGNWKMNNDLSETISLISGIKKGLSGKRTENLIIIAPPFISLETAKTLIKETDIKLSAQNMHFEENGAFTGEISAKMLKSVGCEYVILGHSERRTIFGETDQIINKKLKKAFSTDLLPIFCIGESLEERENNETNSVVERQIKYGLDGIPEDDFNNLIIAYEPVWAIGTGKTASPEQAQEVHNFIRNLISEIYSVNSAEKCTILYGGSVKPDNSAELLSQNDIDGALVGGACLKPDSFLGIVYSV